MDNSVSTVSDYGQDERGSNPDIGRVFSSSVCVQTGSGAHPTSYTLGTVGILPRGKSAAGA
jgi:hypothetical protein